MLAFHDADYARHRRRRALSGQGSGPAEKKTAEQIISALARKGLTAAAAPTAREPKAIYGFRPFPKEGRIVSNELIDKLREDGEY
jgi:hypothetical protein